MAQILSVYPRTEEGFPAGSVVKEKKKNPLARAGDLRDMVQFLDLEESLEKEMATHSSILAGKIPWTEETGGL